MLYKYFVSLLFLSVVIPINAQETKVYDSLLTLYKSTKQDTIKVKTIDKIIQLQLYSNPEKAKKYIEEMITLSKDIRYASGEAKGYHRLAGYYYNQDKIDSSLIFFKKSQRINIEINNLTGIINDNEQLGLLYSRVKEFDSAFYYLEKNVTLYENRNFSEPEDAFELIGSTYHTIAGAHTTMGSFNLALKFELEALKLYEEYGDPLFIADAYNSLSAIENELGNFGKALNHINPAIKTYKENNDVFFLTLAIINKGVALQGLKRHRQAINNYNEGIDIAQSNNYKGRETLMWSNMANSYYELKDYDNAKQCYWKAIKQYKTLKYPLEISSTYNNLGRLYTKTTQLDSALIYLNHGIKISDSTNFLKVSAQGYQYRSETFKKLNDYKRSLSDYKLYSKLKDSMFNEKKSKQIEELRTIYETEKKEQQIKIQKNEIELLGTKNKVSNLQRIMLALALALALIAVYAFYQRNKRNKLAKEKAEIDLEFKTKELTTHALHLAKKNEVLNDLKQKAKVLKADADADPGYQMLIQTINFDLQDDNNWENFSRYFEEVHKDFNAKAQQQFPNITTNDLRLMALLKMNLSSKEIANILNISSDGIKKARQRLRKKMGLDSNDSLETVVIAI